MSRLRVAFAGTPAFAAVLLGALLEAGHEVALVVTRPDRPAGRGLKVRPSEVKQLAQRAGLRVWQPERPDPDQWVDQLQPLQPDALVVAAFAHRIPVRELAFLPLGCLNVHASLLPRWRGAAPVAWALLAGDRVTGVTLLQMDEGWDTGPILLQRTELIRPDDTADSLQRRLAALGARALLEGLDRLAQGTLRAVSQDPAGATHAPRLRKEQGEMDWSGEAQALERQVRALQPWPGAYTHVRERVVKVLAARAVPDPEPSPQRRPQPGEVVGPAGPQGLAVACGRGHLHLLQVQPEGGRVMTGRDLANGMRLRPGERLGGASR